MYNNKFDYMEGHDFERYCAILLENIGFYNIEVTPGSNDNGIDILASRGGVKYGIQCKCYSSDIGVKAVQEALSGAQYYDCHVPVVLTNRYFTKQAQEMARKTNVLLWDRRFLTFMVEAIEKSEEDQNDTQQDTASECAQAPSTDETQQAQPQSTGAGELRELKMLLDEEIITQDEFDAKKRQILGL